MNQHTSHTKPQLSKISNSLSLSLSLMKKTNKQYNKHNSAFTIVELLIVIVVIAILAAITVVAYNGIQTRAYNAATMAQAKQTIDLVNAYIAVEGRYPSTSTLCATIDNQCTLSNGTVMGADNTNLIANLRTIGTPANSRVASEANGRYGILYSYSSAGTRIWNNEVQPVLIQYILKGQDQSCNLPNVMNSAQTGPSTTGNSGGTGYTTCFIHIDGPTS